MLAYVLQVKVEMELEIQQCEKTKAVREEQLERLTQICQEQAVSTKTLAFPAIIILYMCTGLYNMWLFMSTNKLHAEIFFTPGCMYDTPNTSEWSTTLKSA